MKTQCKRLFNKFYRVKFIVIIKYDKNWITLEFTLNKNVYEQFFFSTLFIQRVTTQNWLKKSYFMFRIHCGFQNKYDMYPIKKRTKIIFF